MEAEDCQSWEKSIYENIQEIKEFVTRAMSTIVNTHCRIVYIAYILQLALPRNMKTPDPMRLSTRGNIFYNSFAWV